MFATLKEYSSNQNHNEPKKKINVLATLKSENIILLLISLNMYSRDSKGFVRTLISTAFIHQLNKIAAKTSFKTPTELKPFHNLVLQISHLFSLSGQLIKGDMISKNILT